MEQFSGATIILWNKLPENERYNLVRSIQNREAAQRVWQKDWSSLSESERGSVSRAMTNKDILVRALTGDVVSPDEYPTDKVKASFSHISHSSGDAAYLHRNSFLEAVQSEYDDALPFAETEEQQQILKAEIDRFKQEYIAKENPSMAVRSSTYSAHIAGGSKFNANQAGQRNNALDRSQSGFSSWLSSQSGRVKNAVLAGRNQSQLDAVANAKAEKAAKQKAGMLELLGRIVAFKRGDQVKFGSYQIAKVSLGKDGYPTSVTVDATDLTDNKFDIARTFFGGDKAKLRSLVDEIRADLSKNEAQQQYDEVVAKFQGTDLWMKAPNGGPTRLNERQWVQTQTPAFKEWFGGSQVLDENGEPLVVFHGTNTKDNFTEFAPMFDVLGTHFGTFEQAKNRGATEGRNIPVYLSAQNLLRVEDPGTNLWGTKKVGDQLIAKGIITSDDLARAIEWPPEDRGELFVDAIKQAGYDGVIYENMKEGDGTSFVAFSPNQIKSATGNTGEFSLKTDDIRYSRSKIEPWQMTRDEWTKELESNKGNGAYFVGSTAGHIRKVSRISELHYGTQKWVMDTWPKDTPYDEFEGLAWEVESNTHKVVILKALSEGKPVPAEVLADYPDLQPQEPTQQNTVAQVQAELRSFLGDDFERLTAARDLRVVQGEKELPWRNGLLKMVAYHGSSHQFKKFSTDNIGTGEGGQAYGHGLYFAGNREVAEFYREKLATGPTLYKGEYIDALIEREKNSGIKYALRKIKADTSIKNIKAEISKNNGYDAESVAFVSSLSGSDIEQPTGELYQVELAPSEDEYLLWDKPLSAQSEKVMAALLEAITKTEDEQRIIDNQSKASGAFIYKALAIDMGDKSASEYLHSLGIRGIKYLDADSRRAGEGTYNYVVFSDNDVEITARYSRHNQKVGGAYDPSTDTMYLVADGIEPGQVEPVLLHEGFHRASHRGDLQPILDELGHLDKLAEMGTGEMKDWFVAARAAAQSDRNTPHYLEEIGAYAVRQYEAAPNPIKRWVDKLVATVKASLFSFFGIRVGKVDPAMLREIAASGLKRSADQAPVTVADDYALAYYRQLGITEKEAQRQYDEVVSRFKGTDLWMKAPNGEPTRLNERQWVQAQTPAFKEWFGGSKVVDENGEPMVMYHGTSVEFTRFKRRTGDIGMHSGTVEQAGDRGAYLAERGVRSPEGQKILPLVLSIKNPLRMRDAGAWNKDNLDYQLRELFPADISRIRLLNSTKDIRDFIQSKGYDGVVYKNTGEVAGAEPYRVAISVARAAMSLVFPAGKNSFSREDQNVPEYLEYSKAQKAYENFRETSGEDSYIAFSPNQIKSALGNTGQFSSYSDDIRYSRDQAITAAKAIYSKLEQVAKINFLGMKAQGVANFLAKQGVKKAEMEAVGLDAFLAAKKPADKVTQAELVDFVKANTVELEDVVLGGETAEAFNDRAAQLKLTGFADFGKGWTAKRLKFGSYSAYENGVWKLRSNNANVVIDDIRNRLGVQQDDKFAQYTEPGAAEGSYREMFVTTPVKSPFSTRERDEMESLSRRMNNEINFPLADKNRYNELNRKSAEQIDQNWKDGHSQYGDIFNPVVRIRFNTVEADGKILLRIEEMQGPSKDNQAKMPKHLRENIFQVGVKRILAYAKENGFDGVALATKPGMSAGETQAGRYSLEKQINGISYERTTNGSKVVDFEDLTGNGHRIGTVSEDGEIVDGPNKGRNLSDIVGKEHAKRILQDKNPNGIIEGIELKVGGEGLKQLYDTTLPAMLEAYSKGKMVAASLAVPGSFKGDDTAHFYAAESFKQDGQSKQEAIDGMRQAYPDSSEASITGAVEAVYGSTISYIPLANAPSSYPLYCKTTAEAIPAVFTSDQAKEVRCWLQKYVETGHFDYYRYNVFSKRLQAAEDGVDHIEWATGLYAEMVAEEQREGLRVEENEAARAAANQKRDEENARIKAEMKAGRCENQNMQAWLDTLENPAKEAYHENGVFNLSSYSSFIGARSSEFQKNQKLYGCSKYDHVALARHLREYVDANLSDRVKRELDHLDFAIKETYANDEFWKVILDSSALSGPFDGGCLICAKAIMAAAGRGEIVRIVSNLNDGQTEHYGVRICSEIFDFGGRHESPEAWIKWLAEEEGITDRTLSFAEGMGTELCILSDCTAENAIAGMLRDVRPKAEQEDRLPEKIAMGGPRG